MVLDAATAAHVAGGICWAVGKANGLFRPQGERTMGRVKEALALHTTISTYGKVVQRALIGYRDPASQGWWRPDELPELLALGHPDLLPARCGGGWSGCATGPWRLRTLGGVILPSSLSTTLKRSAREAYARGALGLNAADGRDSRLRARQGHRRPLLFSADFTQASPAR